MQLEKKSKVLSEMIFTITRIKIEKRTEALKFVNGRKHGNASCHMMTDVEKIKNYFLQTPNTF